METIVSQNKSILVRILVVLWGEKFINDFLKLNIRTLLAPGNIPALANEYPLHFVLLTTKDDIPIFEKNPIFTMLKQICTVEFISIDDLIIFSNYSTTLTLAYDRAVKNTGLDMLNTYFIFLTADYIMADDSFIGLMRYMKKGYSGICAGNFQVIEEEIKPFLMNQIDNKTKVLSIKPRDLLKKSLNHLHLVSYTNIYHQNLTHNYYANRFFLKYNDDLLAGRFYLLHMLCIKPETMDYQVGASCDYSFIPEMCPSGNIAIINDSDDYLVIELQPRDRDLQFTQSGKYNFNRLASALAEWTTSQHRDNAKKTIYYHTKDLQEEDTKQIENKLDELVHLKLQKLKKYKTKPHFNHPYWLGAIKSFHQQRSVLQNSHQYDYVNLTVLDNTPTRKFYLKIFGKPPLVYLLHHRWIEYHRIKKKIKSFIIAENWTKTAVFYDSYESNFMHYREWLEKSLNISDHFHAKNLLNAKDKLKTLKKVKYKFCILFLRMENIKGIKKTLKMIYQLLERDGQLLIIIPNDQNFQSRICYNFSAEFILRMKPIENSPFKITKIHTINNNLTHLGENLVHQLKVTYAYNKKIKLLLFVILMIPVVFYSLLKNILHSVFNNEEKHCTNILLELKPHEELIP